MNDPLAFYLNDRRNAMAAAWHERSRIRALLREPDLPAVRRAVLTEALVSVSRYLGLLRDDVAMLKALRDAA